MSEDVRLDWASAEVHDGKLVVALEGEPPEGWADAFERTAHLLNQGTWEKVRLKDSEVQIRPVTPGEEDRVRHFLESIVLQANSAASADEAGAPDGDATRSAEQEASESDEDQQMTARLRSFAASEDNQPD